MAIIKCRVHPSATKQPKAAPFKPLSTSRLIVLCLRPGGEDFKQWKSIGTGIGNAVKQSTAKYESLEMQQREIEARSVKHTVAPISNKGGYQLIINKDDLKTMGQKI